MRANPTSEVAGICLGLACSTQDLEEPGYLKHKEIVRIWDSVESSFAGLSSLFEGAICFAALEYSSQCRHFGLYVVIHNFEHAVGRPMGVGWALADIAQPWMWHCLCQIFLRHGPHWVELFPEGLALDIILMYSS